MIGVSVITSREWGHKLYKYPAARPTNYQSLVALPWSRNPSLTPTTLLLVLSSPFVRCITNMAAKLLSLYLLAIALSRRCPSWYVCKLVAIEVARPVR
jgi:hypothetical protein